MGNTNPMIECLGRYSKSNLALMLFDNQHELAANVWHCAGRFRHYSMVANDATCRSFIDLVKNSFYDAVLLRQIENLSAQNQHRLAKVIARMSSVKRGKIIFTTKDFERVESRLLSLVCKIKFRIQLEAENLPAEEPNSFDYERQQSAVGRYF